MTRFNAICDLKRSHFGNVNTYKERSMHWRTPAVRDWCRIQTWQSSTIETFEMFAPRRLWTSATQPSENVRQARRFHVLLPPDPSALSAYTLRPQNLSYSVRGAGFPSNHTHVWRIRPAPYLISGTPPGACRIMFFLGIVLDFRTFPRSPQNA